MQLSLLAFGEFSLFSGFPLPLDAQRPTDTHRVKQLNRFWTDCKRRGLSASGQERF